MPSDTSPPDTPDEIEISLDDAELELRRVEVDSTDLPIEFSISGVLRDLDTDVMEELTGADLEPTTVRFRLLSNTE